MIAIDVAIVSFLNQFATRSATFDQLVWLLANNYLLKSGLVLVLLYWAWFKAEETSRDDRATIVFGLFASCVAIGLARLLAVVAPFRERPLRNPDLHFLIPTSMKADSLLGWSAFPSDTSTLWFGIAATLFLVSRRWGLVAFAYTFIVVGLARVYLGIHYPSDILAGALIGVGAVSLIHFAPLKAAVTRVPLKLLRDRPRLAQTTFCVLTFLIGTTFEPVYQLGIFVIKAAKHSVDAL